MKNFAIGAFVCLLCSASGIAEASSGLASISAAQVASIQSALDATGIDSQLQKAIMEATPTIVSFLKINSCLSGYNASSLNTFAAPGKTYPNNNYIGGPMPTMYKHNKGTCATVLRVQGWSMPSKNSLQFEVVYVADDSGESGKTEHEVQKQPSGQWLFTR